MSETEVNEKIYDHRILTDWSNVNNTTSGIMHYSKDMIFNDGHRLSITIYRYSNYFHLLSAAILVLVLIYL